MRCWLGTEVEHNLNYGNLTLFVDSSVVSASKLIQILNDNNLINISIYFGANQNNLICLSATNEELDYLKNNYKLIVEVTEKFMTSIDYRLFDNVILTQLNNYSELIPTNVSLKLKDKKDCVYVLNLSQHDCKTSLSELNTDGMFEGNDKLLYED